MIINPSCVAGQLIVHVIYGVDRIWYDMLGAVYCITLRLVDTTHSNGLIALQDIVNGGAAFPKSLFDLPRLGQIIAISSHHVSLLTAVRRHQVPLRVFRNT